METTVNELQLNSKFLISKFTRQVYTNAVETLDNAVADESVPMGSLVVAFSDTAILSPSDNKQVIFVEIAAAGTVRVRRPTEGCTEFTMILKTPRIITVNAFPSGTILSLMAAGQTIHSIRFIWDSVLDCWRSVRTA